MGKCRHGEPGVGCRIWAVTTAVLVVCSELGIYGAIEQLSLEVMDQVQKAPPSLRHAERKPAQQAVVEARVQCAALHRMGYVRDCATWRSPEAF